MLLQVLIPLLTFNNKFNGIFLSSCFLIVIFCLFGCISLNNKAENEYKLTTIEILIRYGKIFSCSVFGKRAVVSADPSFNRFIMQNEGKLFQSSYPKSFRDLVGKNGVITVQGDQQRKLHGIASNMMRLDKLKFHFLKDIQMVMLQTLNNFRDNQVILLQDVCRKASILQHLPRLLEQLVILHDMGFV